MTNKSSAQPNSDNHLRKSFRAVGHLVDSGIMKEILDTIIREDGKFSIDRFDIGKTNDDQSVLEATYTAENATTRDAIARHLIDLGVEIDVEHSVKVEISPADGVAPKDFYTTTNHKTTITYNGHAIQVDNVRMDGAIVVYGKEAATKAKCVKQRDLKSGDKIVVGVEGIRVEAEFVERDRSEFGFMTGDVSSERVVRIVVDSVAEVMSDRNKKIVVVAGPVLIHTGGSGSFGRLVEQGYVHGLLSGNALAVHDIENQLFGTSLGIDTKTGEAIDGGNSHHLRAINEVRRAGSIKNMVEAGLINRGVMSSIVKANVPYALAGSIRDDGPLPETITDMNEAQTAYGKILEGADVCLMLASMLHSIAVGNMIPARVLTVCVDINPPVVTKLKDRGSHQAIGVVTDVGLFLHLLANRLCK
ncbi:TIGR00300 family protein [bacterium AH-315-J21]|nr:TIGR00300 family protein [bacterium AH-315-J21]